MKKLIERYRRQDMADLIVVKANRSLESRIRKVAEGFGVKIVALRSEDKQHWKKRLEQNV